MTKIEDIRDGVLRFRKKVFPVRRALYEELASHQAPQILFITCIDSHMLAALTSVAKATGNPASMISLAFA